MSGDGGSYQRIGKKGRVWVPDVAGGDGEPAPVTVAAPAKAKPAAKRARKRGR